MEAKSRRGRKQNSRTDIHDRHIDRDDHDLLVFAVRWLPYGGGPDDEVLITFGMSPERYRECLRDVVQRQLAHIRPDTATRLIRMCDPDNGKHFRKAIEDPNQRDEPILRSRED